MMVLLRSSTVRKLADVLGRCKSRAKGLWQTSERMRDLWLLYAYGPQALRPAYMLIQAGVSRTDINIEDAERKTQRNGRIWAICGGNDTRLDRSYSEQYVRLFTTKAMLDEMINRLECCIPVRRHAVHARLLITARAQTGEDEAFAILRFRRRGEVGG